MHGGGTESGGVAENDVLLLAIEATYGPGQCERAFGENGLAAFLTGAGGAVGDPPHRAIDIGEG